MDEKIIKILELVQTKEDETVEFPEEAKKLIHEVAEECRELRIYKKNAEKAEKYAVEITAEEVYMDMCYKICNAPTRLHMLATARLLIPIIDNKLQEKKDAGMQD